MREDRVTHKRLEYMRGFLIYVARTSKWMMLYLKGLHLTIGGWQEVRDKDLYKTKIQPRVCLNIWCENTRYLRVRIHNTYGLFRTNYTIRYTVRTYFPRKLHDTIHSTYGFPRTNYTIRMIILMYSQCLYANVGANNVCTRTLARTVLVSNSNFCYTK